MKKIGRNDPCPCGSGLKYKKCCLLTRSGRPQFNAHERASALRKLEEFIDEPGWRHIEEHAEAVFWGPYLEAFGQLEDDDLGSMAESAFDFWFFFDHRPEGRSRIVEEFLNGPADLREGERRYLEQATRTCMRLYEVVEARPGESLRLRDLTTFHEVRVRERLASQQLRKWDLLAARVMPAGASGQPEIDGGCYPLPRINREDLLAQMTKALKTFQQNVPGGDELGFYETLPPFFNQAWLQPLLEPKLPKLVTTDGDELLLTKAYFQVNDEEQVAHRLDSANELEREAGETVWNWYGQAGQDGTKVVLGRFRLQGEHLTLETASAERAERGRALVERLVGDAARYRLASQQTPEQALAELGPAGQEEPELPPEAAAQAVEEYYQRHYRGWLDEAIPALDGKTPRQAARSAPLRPRILELLKDLENMYQRSLEMGQHGFDPSWMWGELGLSDLPEALGSHDHPPLTGYESMERHVVGIGDVARGIANRFRKQPGFDASTVITREDLATDLTLSGFVTRQALEAHRKGMNKEDAAAHGNLIGAHLEYMCNFELHRRKTFWVDEALAWMLDKTRLELVGDQLRLPFASFALIFSDRYTLRVAERMLSVDPTCEQRGQILKVATAYVLDMPAEDARGLRIAFTFDALAGQWPYMVTRDLYVEPEARLDSIVASHFPEVDVEGLDPMFSSAALARLVRLVINGILYATSAGVEPELHRPSGKKRQHETQGLPDRLPASSDEVFYLPGKIDITGVRDMQALERAPDGGKLMHRFMVRGHWRRAAPTWEDQRPRWIRPYWKGPDMATVIERAYRLKP